MLKSRRMAWTLTLSIAITALIGVSAAVAADESKIGVVDTARVYKDAPRIKKYTEDLNVFRQNLGAKLDIRNQNRMLDENEVKELIDLKLKENATDKDKARLKELEDTERARDAELKTLQETKEPDDAKKTRLKQLQDMQQSSNVKGNELAKDYDEQLSNKMLELNNNAEKEVRDAIKVVAEAKGLTLVIAKEAVLFGGIDISDAIIAKME